jgi:cytosolic 5'-nucleotidase 3
LSNGRLLRDCAEELRLKYHPIEIDVHIKVEEKVPFMIEWWRAANELFSSTNLTKSIIQDLVQQSNMELKRGAREFITELLRSETPILIFSAGLGELSSRNQQTSWPWFLGDIIELFLEKEIPVFKHNHQSSHIVSNFIQYDGNGKLVSFNEKFIHSFNKNEQEIHDTPYYQTILNRSNVILLGDSLGDVGMTGGMKNLQNILKIGYLNHSTPDKLKVYKQVYDIVICDDQTFDLPNAILNAI